MFSHSLTLMDCIPDFGLLQFQRHCWTGKTHGDFIPVFKGYPFVLAVFALYGLGDCALNQTLHPRTKA
jgi:hypothetical protein